MADGFLSRWSQRKQALREGRAVEESPPPAAPAETSALVPDTDTATVCVPPTLPSPTLEDVKALNADASFAPFVSRDVAPEVRNAAMKKLFADPHYNVMDGLDIYIDDYSLPSPMPAAMLRQMASAKFLNLFDEDPPGATSHSLPVREDANSEPGSSVAQSSVMPVWPDTQDKSPTETLPAAPLVAEPSTKDHPHDSTDLRLQPDHAARPAQSERLPE
jgi:hypothetical protein